MIAAPDQTDNALAQPCLEVSGLGMTYPGEPGAEGLEALRSVSFGLCPQEFVCLLGPSGSGKSTLLRLLAGLLKPSTGQIHFAAGEHLRSSAGSSSIVKSEHPRTSVVFQDANLLPWKTVLENVALPLELRATPAALARERARAWIELVGLRGFEQAWPRELSGGMAQRVALARALIQEPGLLLLDEPFGALDALTREKMAAELLRLWQARRTTVLMVTHSISEALILSDRVLVFSPRPGRLVLDLPVSLPRPREEDLRYTPEFGRLAQELRKAIT